MKHATPSTATPSIAPPWVRRKSLITALLASAALPGAAVAEHSAGVGEFLSAAEPIPQTTPYDNTIMDMAVSANGNYVMAWNARAFNYTPDDFSDVHARVFNERGEPLSDEIPVNATTAGTQTLPRVAMNDAGEFVVVWSDYGLPNDTEYQTFLRGRRFHADGAPASDEFLVPPPSTTFNVSLTALAMAGNGDFVVSYYRQTYETVVRHFGADGTPGPEQLIATRTFANSNIAMDAAGNFVVLWESDSTNSDTRGMFYQYFGAGGVPGPAGAQRVNPNEPSGGQRYPHLAMNSSGAFVITWAVHNSPDTCWMGYCVFVRAFEPGGVPARDAFRVETTHPAMVYSAAVAMGDHGDFVLAYECDDTRLCGRAFNADATVHGDEFVVGESTYGALRDLRVYPDGDFVVLTTDAYQPTFYGYRAGGSLLAGPITISTPETAAYGYVVTAMLPGGDLIVGWSGSVPPPQEAGVNVRRVAGFEAGPAFRFHPRRKVPPGQLAYSNTVTVSGLGGPRALTLTGDGSARYSKNGGPWTAEAGTIQNGDTLQLLVAAGPLAGVGGTHAVVHAGAYAADFKVLTDADVIVDPFDFPDRIARRTDHNISSSVLTPGGFNKALRVSVGGDSSCRLRVGDGAFRRRDVIEPGQELQLRLRSAATPATVTRCTVTLGGMTDNWSVITAPDR